MDTQALLAAFSPEQIELLKAALMSDASGRSRSRRGPPLQWRKYR